MLEHEHQRTTHHEEAIEASAIQPPEPAALHQQQVQNVPPAASFAELTGQPKVAEPGKTTEAPLANVDAVIEQLAHGMVAKDLDDNDQKFLAANGYAAQPIIRGVHEFVMRTFLPTQAGKPPIVAFRGTVPSKVQTLIADVDPTGIGMYQFNPNRALIDGQMLAASTHGQVVSSGHSLGGALAQIAAATFPDRVGRIVTFQAPGVSRDMAKKLEQYNAEHPDQAIESTHHRVKGDLVPLGGQALTPGVIHNHEMTGGSLLSRNPLAKHTSMPLAEEEIAQGHDVPIHGDHGSVETGEVSTEHDNEHKTQVIENVRAGLGHVIFGVGNAIHKVTH
ncbi:MAG TPA: alpha/beta fold hydrolase [Kofleriaceae bacterium]|nr:alpha/beta fold hydrolase [Kofleriaceae bacterium]